MFRMQDRNEMNRPHFCKSHGTSPSLLQWWQSFVRGSFLAGFILTGWCRLIGVDGRASDSENTQVQLQMMYIPGCERLCHGLLASLTNSYRSGQSVRLIFIFFQWEQNLTPNSRCWLILTPLGVFLLSLSGLLMVSSMKKTGLVLCCLIMCLYARVLLYLVHYILQISRLLWEV